MCAHSCNNRGADGADQRGSMTMARDEQGARRMPGGRAAGSDTALTWRKSTVSNPSGNCVELAVLADGGVAVRNSRFPGGAHLTYTRSEIAAFVRGVRSGEFDDLLY
jgi:Domain of unknown function (DUF397)